MILSCRGRSSRLADPTCVVLDTGTICLSRRIALSGERFETSVDPGPAVPAAGATISGITAAMATDAHALTTALLAFRHSRDNGAPIAQEAFLDMEILRRAVDAGRPRFDDGRPPTVALSAMIQGVHGMDARPVVAIAPKTRHTPMDDAQVILPIIPP